MTEFAARLAELDASDQDFLAGLLFARGKVYIGRTARGSSFRYSPSLSLELPLSLPPRLAAVFDGPYERRYYAHPVLRYVLQDTAKIATVLQSLTAAMPASQALRMETMIAFCRSTSETDRARLYEEFNAS